uniref:Uncharacterized protein n=1 Tax=Vitis vinifera TaxID=29760 RepID=F6HSD1_VITVI
MSSGTIHFPAILVTVTCNPRRCVRTPLSGRERKDFSEQPPRFQTQESTFPYEHSVHVSVRGRVKGSPLLRISPLILDRSSEGYPSPKAPRDHLPLVFGRRGLLYYACNVGLIHLQLLWKYYLNGLSFPYFKYFVQYLISYWVFF